MLPSWSLCAKVGRERIFKSEKTSRISDGDCWRIIREVGRECVWTNGLIVVLSRIITYHWTSDHWANNWGILGVLFWRCSLPAVWWVGWRVWETERNWGQPRVWEAAYDMAPVDPCLLVFMPLSHSPPLESRRDLVTCFRLIEHGEVDGCGFCD